MGPHPAQQLPPSGRSALFHHHQQEPHGSGQEENLPPVVSERPPLSLASAQIPIGVLQCALVSSDAALQDTILGFPYPPQPPALFSPSSPSLAPQCNSWEHNPKACPCSMFCLLPTASLEGVRNTHVTPTVSAVCMDLVSPSLEGRQESEIGSQAKVRMWAGIAPFRGPGCGWGSCCPPLPQLTATPLHSWPLCGPVDSSMYDSALWVS